MGVFHLAVVLCIIQWNLVRRHYDNDLEDHLEKHTQVNEINTIYIYYTYVEWMCAAGVCLALQKAEATDSKPPESYSFWLTNILAQNH